MSYRKEKKYKFTFSEMFSIKENFLKKGMKQLYPSRIINSCYFDNQQLKLFHDSEEGVLPRKKVRIRWYNKNKIFTKETKISSIEGRFKYAETISDILEFEDLYKMKIIDNIYGELKPLILVKYNREYYKYKNLRITFDKNISYNYLKLNTKPNFFDQETVMEVKTSNNCDDNYIEDLVKHPTSRFSKYTRGILHSNIF